MLGDKYVDRGGKIVRKYLSVIKSGLVLLLLVFIVLDMKSDKISDAKIEEIAKSTVKAAGFQNLERAENRMIKRFYGFNVKDYEGAVLYAPKDNMDVNELFIVKLKDTAQKGIVEEAIAERLETQLESFKGYGAEQTALLKKHVLVVEGNYVLYIVGKDAQTARETFLKSL